MYLGVIGGRPFARPVRWLTAGCPLTTAPNTRRNWTNPARWHRGGWSVTRRREDRSTVPVALAETVEKPGIFCDQYSRSTSVRWAPRTRTSTSN